MPKATRPLCGYSSATPARPPSSEALFLPPPCSSSSPSLARKRSLNKSVHDGSHLILLNVVFADGRVSLVFIYLEGILMISLLKGCPRFLSLSLSLEPW